jgi:sugar phosphate isomerase/epimerase
MNRRNFIKNSLWAAPFATNSFYFDENHFRKKNIIGIQLYTVRDEMKANPEATLASLRKIGYRKVEGAFYHSGKIFNQNVKDFKKYLINEGMKMPSGHVSTGQEDPAQTGTLINNFEKAVVDAAALGQEYIVCGWLAEFERKTLDDYKHLAEKFNKAGELCKSYGIQFCYHNHDFEFDPLHSVVPYDLLLRECDDDLVKMELDLYWITKAGKNALSYFEQYPLRFPLFHVKDMSNDDKKTFTEVGSGTINFASIFAHKEKAGLKHFFVEQDNCEPRKPIESAIISYNYLKNKNFIQ